MRAEGVQRIALVAEDLSRHRPADFPPGVTFHDRSALDAVQRELREIPGVTALIYDQACAAEKRRRRKRGQLADPLRRVVINEAVCEGCGDCGKQSNCLSIVPVETEFGRKRQIDQASCNKDYSCLKGFCPAMVTVDGAALKAPHPKGGDLPDTGRLPAPARAPCPGPASPSASAAPASSRWAPSSPWRPISKAWRPACWTRPASPRRAAP